MGAISKNQRAGAPRAPQRKRYCAQGHELERVLVVRVKGRRRFWWRCACGLS